jgi:glutaminyl-peptide cyclotransferase
MYFCWMRWPYFALIFISFAMSGCASNDSGQDGNTGSNTPILTYSIVAAYPHDTSSFTQGLVIHDGRLLEGTGNKGRSRLMEIDLSTGRIIKKVDLDPALFGEGITVLNDTLYQLTWQEHKVLVYDVKDFRKIKEFPLPTDGWGLTNDDRNLIVTDGSSNLYFYEPQSFRLLRTQGVTEDGSPAGNLNELEFINGFIYANQWQMKTILKIDPQSGQVVAKMDFSDLVNRVQAKIPQLDTGQDAVLNGIAYDAATNKIYITGKNWPELYEVQFEH